jgi:hypothetical protein
MAQHVLNIRYSIVLISKEYGETKGAKFIHRAFAFD